MTTLDAIMLKDLVSPRPGPHLSAYLPEALDTDRRLSARLGRCFRHGPDEWSGWFDATTTADDLSRRPELQADGEGPAGRAGGAVAFVADGFTRVFPLLGNTTDRLVGGSVFFLTPLLAALQADRAFHLLTLSRHRAQLFRGDAHALHPVAVTDIPAGVDDPALAQLHGKAHTTHTVGRTHGGRVEAVFHGHADGGSDRKHDLERYLRAVASAVADTLGSETTPLVLAGVEEEMASYRRVNTYPHLLAGGVGGNPDHLSVHALHTAAWPLAEAGDPAYQPSLRVYHQLRGTGRTADAIEDLVLAATEGTLGTLLVSPDRSVWGTFDPVRRRVEVHTPRQPGDEELTNLAAVQVLRHGGVVFAVPNGELGDRSALGMRWLPMARHGKGGPS